MFLKHKKLLGNNKRNSMIRWKKAVELDIQRG